MHGVIGSLSKGGGAWGHCLRVAVHGVIGSLSKVHGAIGSLSKGGAWCNRVIV